MVVTALTTEDGAGWEESALPLELDDLPSMAKRTSPVTKTTTTPTAIQGRLTFVFLLLDGADFLFFLFLLLFTTGTETIRPLALAASFALEERAGLVIYNLFLFENLSGLY